MSNFFRVLYTALLILALPLLFLRLLWRSRKLPAYRQRWLERLGFFPKLQVNPHGVWVHAVSVGEVVAALPLIHALRAQDKHLPITVTTTTPTGSQRVKQSLHDTVTHVYLPYDFPWALQSFLRKIQPRSCIILETELWPNLLNTCKQRKIPVIIANGRISDRSLLGYKRIQRLVTSMLQQIAYVAAQSRQDTDRFIALGMDKDKVHTTGNLKFDVQVNAAQQQAAQMFKPSLGSRLVLVAASTHEGEETIILQAMQQLQAIDPRYLLILIPRHPDRFNAVADLLAEYKFNYVRRSQEVACTDDVQVMLGDSMGEMYFYYSLADVAFVGGSLVPIGGHNLLEPASLGATIITGPHLHNFTEITNLLLAADALRIINNSNELVTQVTELFTSSMQRERLGTAALRVVDQNRGALDRVLDGLYSVILKN